MQYICRLNKPEGSFEPSPCYGHGMNESLRTSLIGKMEQGINVFILVDDGVVKDQYGQWLDVLEMSNHFASKTGKIRIYPLDAYVKGTQEIKRLLAARP